MLLTVEFYIVSLLLIQTVLVEEYQFFRNGELYDHFRFQWYWEDRYSNNLVLDYGRKWNLLYDNVDIYRGVMTGIFYLTGDSEGFSMLRWKCNEI